MTNICPVCGKLMDETELGQHCCYDCQSKVDKQVDNNVINMLTELH